MAMEKDCKVVTTLSGTEYIRALAEDGSTVRIPVAELGKVMAQVMPVATSEKNGLMQKTGLIDLGVNSTYKSADELPNGYLRYQHPDDYETRNFPFAYGCILTVKTAVVGFQISSSQDGRMAWRTKWENSTAWRYLPL